MLECSKGTTEVDFERNMYVWTVNAVNTKYKGAGFVFKKYGKSILGKKLAKIV